MKGTIVKCLEELVITQFGKEKWEKSLRDAGLDGFVVFWPTLEVDDSQVMALIEAVCKNLDVSLAQAADAFGDYWVNVYSQKMYPLYYERHPTARDFLLALDHIHAEMTQALENSHPPSFSYEWVDDRTLIMHYKSQRGLIDFVVGLAKGVAKFYQEELQVSKLEPDKVQIVFA